MQLLGLLRRELRTECRQWVAEGDISAEQGDRILARYGTSLDDHSDGSLAYKVLVTVALLFVGLAILLLVSANWDEIPRAVRMLGLIGTSVAINLLGIRALLRQQRGSGWLFLGGISYGASIMLIAQIYHLGEHFPDGLFYWALGVAPMAWLAGSRLVTLLMLAVATLWMFSEGLFGAPWTMLLFLALGLAMAVRTRSAGLLLILAGISVSWLNLMLAWCYSSGWQPRVEAGHVTLNLGLLALLYALSHWLERCQALYLRRAASLIGLWTLRGYLLVLLPFTFAEVCREFLREQAGLWDLGLWWGLAAAVLALGLVLVKRLGSFAPRILLAALPVLMLVLHGLGHRDGNMLMAVAVNLLALLSAMVLIHEGLKRGLTQYFYTGVVMILLLAIMRYLNLFGDYLGAAAMFLVAAGVLYGAARFWRAQALREQAGEGKQEGAA